MELDCHRRKSEHEEKIRQALRDQKLVIVVGAGVTLSATHPSPSRLTWTGLIRDGLDYLLRGRFVAENDVDLMHYRGVLQRRDGNTRSLLRACGYLKDELDHNGQFATWLESVFEALQRDVRHPEVFEPFRRFHQRGARLMTTNYDELLEHYCGLQRVRRSIPEDVIKYEQGKLDGVFHIHGSFQDPKEVVLDATGYYEVKASEDVQNLLKGYLRQNTILFVGCGSGLEDPNFNTLLDWASKREENIANHHYLLVQNKEDLRYQPLVSLRYGPEYKDLVPYLNTLLGDPAHAFVEGKRNTPAEAFSGDLSQLLPYASEAPFNASGKDDHPLCLPQTRVELLQKIDRWANEDNREHIFWLSGWAGTGKSTVARTVAREHYERGQLGASFFFSRGGGDVGNAKKFFTSIAVQLADNVRHLRQHIYAAIRERSGIAGQSFRDQWRHLIIGPLSKLDGNSLSYSLVVDALDECEDENHIRNILQLLSEAQLLKNVRLRVFLTSRPEIPIRHGFYRMADAEHQDFVLHHISPAIIDHDIAVFLRYELGRIGEDHALGDTWPGEEVIKCLVRSASGLFIWASTACRFVREGRLFAAKRLALILKESNVSITAPKKHLDQIYITVLKHSIHDDFTNEEREELCSALRYILGSVVILSSQLSANSLSKLLFIGTQDGKQNVDETLGELHAILDIPDDDPARPLRLHHPSLREFLLDKNRCTDLNFWVDEKKAHGKLAQACIQLMSISLKRDVCGVDSPGKFVHNVESSQVDQHLPPEVQYACLYWVQHLQKSGTPLCDNDQFDQFLQEHFLHWLEALSWMRKMSEAIHEITSLESIALKSDCSRLREFIHDMKRFVLYSRPSIEQAPLQAYCSALIFAPKNSMVRKQFDDQKPRWIRRLPDVRNDWSPLLQALEGHSDGVSAVAFSPDGKQIASASEDETIRLWDASTGAALQTLEGHSNSVIAVVFSSDSKQLASASRDRTAMLWDAGTGAALHTFKGHPDWVRALGFSPDGKKLATVSDDETSKLWDVGTGVALQTFEGHGFSSLILTAAFSPNGKQLASAYTNSKTVKLWEIGTGAVLQMLEGHSNHVKAVAFSPDGKQIASASEDKAIRLWDTDTGAALHTLEGHSDRVTAVAFSSDGKKLASASQGGKTVKLWDASKGTMLQTFEYHPSLISALAFSPDGKQLAFAASDKTVKLWNAGAVAALQTPEGHSHWVTAVVFSPDGMQLASASYDRRAKLWDTGTGALLHTLEGHSDWVMVVAFSRDGQQLASGSEDKTVKLWDASTGAALQTLEGHDGAVRAVAFSRDGKQLASGSTDKTVKLWDTGTGALLHTLEGHSDWVMVVAFSRDGKQLASGSDDETVKLWDASTGAAIQTIETNAVTRTISFSDDGTSLSTDRGLLPITSRSSGRVPSRGVFVQEQWVTWGTENMLWLPPEHRPRRVAVQGSVVALGCQSGLVSIMEFAF